MGWEIRQRGGRYYTRSIREGGRVRREYIGGGATASLIAAYDERERQARADARAAELADREHTTRHDVALAELDGLTEGLARLALLSDGYHRHHRGEWRKRRE